MNIAVYNTITIPRFAPTAFTYLCTNVVNAVFYDVSIRSNGNSYNWAVIVGNFSMFRTVMFIYCTDSFTYNT